MQRSCCALLSGISDSAGYGEGFEGLDLVPWPPLPRTHDRALLCALISDLGGDPSPFRQLVNFNPFGTRLRYDEDEPMGLERSLWNQRCADLLVYVASLIP